MNLPRYRDCEFSLFVSYAHDDDKGHNGWVKALTRAFRERLHQMPRDIPRMNLHLSGVNGPAVGRLGAKLSENVSKSFGMLIVIGQQYVDSHWCEKELEFFHDVYGEAGFANRLFIAVMAEDAFKSARRSEAWIRLVPDDQLWRPFYREDDTRYPIEPERDDGSFNAAFWREACKLVDPLAEEISEDWKHGSPTQAFSTGRMTSMLEQSVRDGGVKTARTPSADARLTVEGDAVKQEQSNHRIAQKRQRVLIGAATWDLDHAISELLEEFQDAGSFDVSTLSKERVSQWEAEGQLDDVFRDVDILVAPFSEAPPLNPAARSGGHLAIQKLEWARQHKGRPILWYRPFRADGKDAPKASAKHLAFIDELSPVYASYEALESALLDPKDGSSRVIVYIEKNPEEKKLWKTLGERMGELWSQLNNDDKEYSVPLDFRARALDIDKLNSLNGMKDADGVVLLFGRKHPSSLLAQINRVENAIPIKRTVFPGFVAFLIPPHRPDEEEVAEHGWDYYRFGTSKEPPPKIWEFHDEDTEDLKEFLRKIRAQCIHRLTLQS